MAEIHWVDISDIPDATRVFEWADALLSVLKLSTGREWKWGFSASASAIKFYE
jgi:hypothetical protein